MAQTSWPFENIDTSETQFSQWARNIGEGVKTGALNELEVYGDSTGLQVKVKSGQAMVRGHYYNNSAEVNLAITAADATNNRIDNIVLELDPSANTIALKVIDGTPAGSPVAPALTQTDGGIYQIKLAEVLVAALVTTINAGDVTDSRSFLATAADLAADVATNTADIATNAGDIATIEASLANPLASFVTDATTARTLTSSDMGKTIRFTSGSATVVTVDASTDFTVGARVDIIADGAGELTVLASGATVAGAATSTTSGSFTIGAQYSAATLLCVATDEYRLIGNIGVV